MGQEEPQMLGISIKLDTQGWGFAPLWFRCAGPPGTLAMTGILCTAPMAMVPLAGVAKTPSVVSGGDALPPSSSFWVW